MYWNLSVIELSLALYVCAVFVVFWASDSWLNFEAWCKRWIA